ncbi:uncharacterized protein [Rutidosis leptorrhynchoides]|uniref:uncharacterized protein n=1 Tax=Rutidosis leptorrhynchoides TaxID=125765 RepID=UPI003A9A54E4
MGFISKPVSKKPFRSVSLPCRSHPSTDEIEKLLNKVKTWESTLSLVSPSAEIICSGFSQLTELYECLDDLVKTNMSQSSSSRTSNQTMKWTDEVLDISVKFLDICSTITEVISQTSQHLRDLSCDLRRNGGCSNESVISKYNLFRNNLKRDIKGSMASLKQVDKMISSSSLNVDSENYPSISMIPYFREVTALSTVIFRISLVFLATPLLKTKTARKWTVVSTRKVVPEAKVDVNVNELQSLDAAVVGYSHCDKHENIQVIKKKLEASEATLESINSSIELMSRRLIGTRASLLNMVSFC